MHGILFVVKVFDRFWLRKCGTRIVCRLTKFTKWTTFDSIIPVILLIEFVKASKCEISGRIQCRLIPRMWMILSARQTLAVKFYILKIKIYFRTIDVDLPTHRRKFQRDQTCSTCDLPTIAQYRS